MVPDTITWRPDRSSMRMFLRSDYPQYAHYDAMHEFGHVLGLFDAYGYGSHTWRWRFLGLDLSWLGDWLLPEAPPDRAPYYCIMRGGWRVTDKEAAMLLWAWNRGRLQLFTESKLLWIGAEVSQAFYY